MNVEEFDKWAAAEEPPLAEPGTRQDPDNRPQLPEQVSDTAEVNAFPQAGVLTPDAVDGLLDATQFEAASEEDTPTPSLENYLFNAVISQEGLFDFFKNLFSPKPGNHDAQAVRVLTQQYRNKDWLSNQTFNSGTVDIGSAARYLSNNGKTDGGVVKRAMAVQRDLAQEIKRLVMFKPNVEKAENMVNNAHVRSPADAARLVKNMVMFTQIYNATVTSVGHLFAMGGAKVKQGQTKPEEAYATADTTMIPALNADGVYDVAGVILGLINMYQQARADLGNMGIAELHHDLEKVLTGYIDSSTEQLEDLFHAMDAVPKQPFVLDYMEKLIWALTVYIDKSLNGVGGKAASVSTEGFVESVVNGLKSLFRGKVKVDEATLGYQIDLTKPSKAKEHLEKTLLSDAWWSERGTTEGEVKVVVPRFMANGDYRGIKKIIEQAEKAPLAKNHKAVTEWFKTNLEPTYVRLTTGKFDTWTVDGVKDMIDTVESIEYPRFEDIPLITTDKTSVTLPALTEAQVKAVAQICVDLIDELIAFSQKVIPKPLLEKVAVKYGGQIIAGSGTTSPIRKKANDIKDADVRTEVIRLIEAFEVEFTQSVENVYQDCIDYWQNYMDVIAALMLWVDKSLGGTVSKEDYRGIYAQVVSNENLLDVVFKVVNIVSNVAYTAQAAHNLYQLFSKKKRTSRRELDKAEDPKKANQLADKIEVNLDKSAKAADNGNDKQKEALQALIKRQAEELQALMDSQAAQRNMQEQTNSTTSKTAAVGLENHTTGSIAQEHFVPGRFGESAITALQVVRLVNSVGKQPNPIMSQVNHAENVIQQTFGNEQWMAVHSKEPQVRVTSLEQLRRVLNQNVPKSK